MALRTGAPRAKQRWGLLVAVVSALILVSTSVVLASHYQSSLESSAFQIDTDANLIVDADPLAPFANLDWANVNDMRKADLPTGSGDDSFGQGSKEDDAVPTVVDGSIPPNKSDLKNFGVYVEENAAGKFLHLFWTRVQDPSGTTNMDFEFNRNKCDPADVPGSTCSGNGITPVRSAGDLLITYDLAKGGTHPILSLREWNGSAWGAPEDLTLSGDATGSINSTAIIAANADGLLALSARTFGEASVDLDAVFDSEQCESFGSAYLKSRSSDSFPAALKDFIAPLSATISNCGSIEITKTDDIGNPLEGAVFTLYNDDGDTTFEPGADDPVAQDQDGNDLTCTTSGDPATCTIEDILFGDYWLDESSVPPGHDKDPSLPQQITIDSTTPVLLSFANPRQTGRIAVLKVDDEGTALPGASFALDSDGDPETTGDQTPIPSGGATGLFCIAGLQFGTYTVVETAAPDGYSGAAPQAVVVSVADDCSDVASGDGDVVSFTNSRLPGAIEITKTTKDKASTDGSSPLAGVEFTVYDSADVVVGTATTNNFGIACLGGLTVGETYTVTETAVPTGYAVDSSITEDVTITDDANCGSGNEDEAGPFENTPLSEIVITFNSLAGDGFTVATSVICTASLGGDLGDDDGDELGQLDDGDSHTLTDLLPGTYTCVVVVDP